MGVAVLLHNKDFFMPGNKAADRLRERKRTQPQGIEMHAFALQDIQCLAHGRAGGAEVDYAQLRLLRGTTQHGLRHKVCSRAEFLQQALHVVNVVWSALGVPRIRVSGRPAGEESALGRMRAWQRAPGNTVPIHILIATKVFACLQFGRSHDLATVKLTGVVPYEGFAQALIHANVQIGHDKNWCLQAVSQVQCGSRMLKTLMRVLRKQQHVLGVTMGCISAGDQVRLLCPGGHAGGRPAALHVDDGDGNFGEVSKADEFRHQRNSRSRRSGKSPRAIPASPDHHADGSQFVFGLHDGIVMLAGSRVYPELVAIFLECLRYRRGRRDGIPGRHRGTAVNEPQCGGTVAISEDLVTHVIGLLHTNAQRGREMLFHKVTPKMKRLDVGFQQPLLPLVLLGEKLLENLCFHVQQNRQCPHVDDVLEQLALARIAVDCVADFS